MILAPNTYLLASEICSEYMGMGKVYLPGSLLIETVDENKNHPNEVWKGYSEH